MEETHKDNIRTKKIGCWYVAVNKLKKTDQHRNVSDPNEQKQYLPINPGRSIIKLGNRQFYILKKSKETDLLECNLVKCCQQKHNNKNNSEDINSDGANCVVCLKELADENAFVELTCGHRFHQDCILQWLRVQKRCPLCQDTPCSVKFGHNKPKRETLDEICLELASTNMLFSSSYGMYF